MIAVTLHECAQAKLAVMARHLADSRTLWIAPGVEAPERHRSVLAWPAAVHVVEFPTDRSCSGICLACETPQAGHAWQVTDGGHGPVVDCSEVKP